jgi:hypothetical protein
MGFDPILFTLFSVDHVIRGYRESTDRAQVLLLTSLVELKYQVLTI